MDVVLSTDCPEILEHARSLGYEGEYFRPKNLGQDDSRIVDAVLDVLSWARKHKDLNYQVVILLQPTSPLRLSSDLDSSLDMLFAAKNASSVISVNVMKDHPVECLTGDSGRWEYLIEPNSYVTGRQSYDDNYFINGAIYACYCDFLISSSSFVEPGKSVLFEMPQTRSVDIDTKEDLELANFYGKLP